MTDLPRLFNSFGLLPSPVAPAAPRTIPQHVDVAIVGAGIIGLSIGWDLAARGLDVALFDAGRAGEGTSAAATGMLAAAAEHEPGGDDLLGLALASQRLWPGFRDRLEADAGRSIDYRPHGTFVVAIGRDEFERLRARFELQRRAGLATTWSSATELRQIEPGLRANVTGGIFCSEDHQVDPPALLEALRMALLRRGGRVFDHQPVTALERQGGRISGLVTQAGTIRAGTVILAMGAMAGSTDWLPPELSLPVRPLKGQALSLRMRRGPLPIDHVVWTSDIHLAPKTSGRLILGATMEDCGFDPFVTAGGILALLDGARRILPGIEEMAIESLWSGFRPTSDDDAPLLGSTPFDGLVVAAGHHRNGYLLAPVTAQAIGDLVTTRRLAGPAARFGPERFTTERQPELATGGA